MNPEANPFQNLSDKADLVRQNAVNQSSRDQYEASHQSFYCGYSLPNQKIGVMNLLIW
jgi:hypothetical protein